MKRNLVGVLVLGILFMQTLLFGQTDEWSSGFTESQSGLKYKILKQGLGDFPEPGDKVWLHFVGFLENDSSEVPVLVKQMDEAVIAGVYTLIDLERGIEMIAEGIRAELLHLIQYECQYLLKSIAFGIKIQVKGTACYTGLFDDV